MKLNIAAAPHFRTKDNVRSVMIDVLIALIPSVIVSTWVFGLRALWIMLYTMVLAEVMELFIMKVLRKQKNFKSDFSASVTGLLLAMNLSLAVNWWQILIGTFAAIVLGKHVYGGLGKNIFNPALVGRVFMLISFPVAMTTWYRPFYFKYDTITTATPLAILKEKGVDVLNNYSDYSINLKSLFVGTIPGSIGEVSALALIIGFIYLVVRGRIKIWIPVTYISTVFVIASIFYLSDPTKYALPLFHVFAGGLMLGALFMATDMVTSPMTVKGQIIFGLGLGLITMIIRLFGGYPEGVSFSILIMNALVPLIDIYAKPRIFGTSRGGKK
ncbi:electron transport complex protein RnfD [Marinitoga hydrogenitolerans DSM 16785]|uniref:Ion-translocating oxidoreductase complex subunit D n=1 Tax=Marinitoga hydrogenitolerans (strain DSM 16785 / JCM 12826 / AT1271) TaxID=1122195 RepID=A0A1M4W0M7_MARH1|nr:RnfABCDGE type electron transport complex subunit D [Marinitoga hydrogenitolerans]SHE74769.1 electron transport complex protein RnfD [Marinitoga hydrogenitolerans DSM 16785]